MKSDGRFICILPPKALDLQGGGAHRACNDAKVAQRLSQFHLNSQVWLSDGGGVAVSTPSVATKTLVRPEVFVNDTLIVAFCGELTNLEELTTKTLYKELCEVGSLPERNLNARVVGMLYETTHNPSQVVAKLRGTFSFAVLDTESVRVFAARDNSGSMPLYQGRLPDGTLVVSNFTPEGLEMEAEVPSGHYLFGNRRANVPQKFSPALQELQRATTDAHSAASHALEGLSDKRKPLVLNPKAASFTLVVSKSQKRKAKARAERPETAGTARGNGKTSLPPPVKAHVVFKETHAVVPVVARLRKEKKRPDTPRWSRGGVFSPLRSAAISSLDHPLGSPSPRTAPRTAPHTNIGTKNGRAETSTWWRKVDHATPFLQDEPDLAREPVSPLKEEKEEVEEIAKVEKVEIPHKEQIELAVRMLHKIASSGKIQILLQQNEETLGSPRSPIKVPSCSNLSRVESMKRVSSMQRVGSDLQSMVGEV